MAREPLRTTSIMLCAVQIAVIESSSMYRDKEANAEIFMVPSRMALRK